jgi:hypothetical protein
MYKVHIGYTANGRDKWRKFDTQSEASEFCNRIFAASGIILTIIKN